MTTTPAGRNGPPPYWLASPCCCCTPASLFPAVYVVNRGWLPNDGPGFRAIELFYSPLEHLTMDGRHNPRPGLEWYVAAVRSCGNLGRRHARP